MNPYDLITILPNKIPPEIINLILSHTNTPTSPALVGTSDTQTPNLNYRKTNWIALPIPIIQNLMQTIHTLYNTELITKYKQPITNIEPIQCLEYPPGNFYDAHNDSEDYINNKLQRVAPRDITLLFYLNDNYEGGNLEFTNLNLSIKPKPGTILAFPSYIEFTHRVHKVTSGTRYSLVSWLQTENTIYPRPY